MVHVLLVALPALLEGILGNGLSGDPELAVERVGIPAGAGEVRERLARGTEPPGTLTVLVARDDAPCLEDLWALLAERPCLQLVILSADGRSAALSRRACPPVLLQDFSMTDLARALRTPADYQS